MTTYLEMRWGGGGKDPSEAELRTALMQMDQRDPEHPDCWLADENGWSIAFHEEGRIVLENPEEDEGPWHLPQASKEMILDLWRLLQKGEINQIRSFSWKEGYK